MNPTPSSEFWAGVRETFPLVVGAIPFGIIFGTLAESGGLSLWAALAFSAIVFAGSAQFIALGMVSAGASWPIIILTTFVVNLRHLLYSTTLLRQVRHLPQRWRVPLAFGLTDETFAVVVRHYELPPASELKHWYYLGSAAFMYLNWQLCTLIGLTFGRLIPGIEHWGLDFAMSASFIGIVVPYLKNRPMFAAALVSGALGVALYDLPNKLGLILATLAGVAIGFLLEGSGNRSKPENRTFAVAGEG